MTSTLNPILVLSIAGAVSGWVCFAVLYKLFNQTSAAFQEIHRLQEDRHQKEAEALRIQAQQIANMNNQIGAMGQHGVMLQNVNNRLLQELQKRGFEPPSDDADWWKRGGNGPRN